MSEFDLIPGGYRQGLRLRGHLRKLGLATVGVALCLIIGKVSLVRSVRMDEREVEKLRISKDFARDQKARLEELERSRANLKQRLAILSALRGGVEARHMFLVIDRALDENVWFLSWKFRRSGELVKNKPGMVNTGYFIVLPKQPQDKTEQAWRIDTHMEIRAQAVDHAALANFVRRLIEQPEIRDVRVLSTRMRRYTSTQVVDFELAVSVNTSA